MIRSIQSGSKFPFNIKCSNLYAAAMTRNDFIDTVKGLLITLVCIGHANQFAINQDGEFWHDPLFKAIYMFHIPLFMAVAGYLSFRGITTTASLTKYLKSRSISYIMPVFAWAIIYQIVVSSLESQTSFENLHITITHNALNHLWFLWALLGSIVLTAIANTTREYRSFVLLVLFFVTLALPENSPIYFIKYTFPFFVAGFSCATFDFSRIQPINLKFLTVILALGSCICFICWEKDTYVYVTKMALTLDNFWNIVFRWLAGIIVSSFVVLFLFYFSPVLPERIKKVLIMAGRRSIYIYILQNYAFLAIFRIIKRLSHSASNVILGDLMAIIIGTLVTYICMWIGSLISKNKYSSLILFGRINKVELITPSEAKSCIV